MNRMSRHELKAFAAQMPKIELHLHLEGAIPVDTLLGLIRANPVDTSIRHMVDLKEKLTYRDFAHFIETWIWKNQFIRDESDFEKIGYDVLKDLHEQNVQYVEAFYSPGDFSKQGLSIKGITANLIRAAQRALLDFGIRSRFIIDLVRDDGPDTGMQRLDEVTPFLGNGVVGIGLGGSEPDYPAGPWAGVYREAGSRGFRLTAHAGEAAGPESVWAALNELKAERIGHGVRAGEDPRLISYLSKKQIPLEMCVTSNVKTGVVPNICAHPIREYLEQGLLITVNSDDPTLFNTSITQEYEALIDGLNFSLDDLKRLSLNAIQASFMKPSEKEQFRSSFENEWDKLCKTI
jgi:adenosine deaminase